MSEAQADVAWSDLPNKGQLAIICLARFSQPVVRTSISTYVFYQLQALDPSKPSDAIVRDAALLQTVFTLAQGFTAVLWGHLADSPRGGRKMVLLVGLGGSFLSTLAFGFITDFRQAVVIRLIEGAVNGNTAMIRTMVSEVVKERRYQAKAFILMPICYNVAAITSPVVAGLLANYASSSDLPFFRLFPYSLPAIASASVALIAFLFVFFKLKETHEEARHKYDPGLHISAKVAALFSRGSKKQPYSVVTQQDVDEESIQFVSEDVEMNDLDSPKEVKKEVLPLRRIFTRNLCFTLIAYGIMEGHVSVYNTLWPSFLSDPVAAPEDAHVRLPFRFVGGLGMPVNKVAISLAFAGILGIPLQFFGYTRVVKRLGMLKTWRLFLRGFPLVYFIIPYLSVVPSSTPRPEPRDGPYVWLAILFAQAVMMFSASFAVPSQIVLTNNASPHPSALGRTHSTAEMVNSFTRTVSPLAAGLFYSYGSAHGIVGLPWWIMSGVTIFACIMSLWVFEGNGHEIKLDTDESDEE
ncbi:major facilitator superfamily domain-containing protein [Xylaria bambusicola]|uniref:major facilitator superfamily domain-containing protein n=1 Tax=Xylaria bambusicola TaxID=326684 RepID=UPI002008D3C4|nr:major facilitator superfamily domain-containing protein [Xylaria bambusicola]KAI0517349.1 major facilitator superfamily domain-containing protein [Xylaria bambusicola]